MKIFSIIFLVSAGLNLAGCHSHEITLNERVPMDVRYSE